MKTEEEIRMLLKGKRIAAEEASRRGDDACQMCAVVSIEILQWVVGDVVDPDFESVINAALGMAKQSHGERARLN